MAAQRDFYLSALASAFDLRAWHFAILLSTAIACSFGRGPSSVSAKGFEAFSFSFRGKTTKIQFLRTFSRFGDGMGWLHGCTTIVLSCRLGFACVSCAAQLRSSGRLWASWNSVICRGSSDLGRGSLKWSREEDPAEVDGVNLVDLRSSTKGRCSLSLRTRALRCAWGTEWPRQPSGKPVWVLADFASWV